MIWQRELDGQLGGELDGLRRWWRQEKVRQWMER